MDEIVFWDRYAKRAKTEKVYGDKALSWTYQTTLGRLTLHSIVKRAVFSRWYGWQMDKPASKSKIVPFIQQYNLDASEFLDRPESFRNFNEFFYRKLKKMRGPLILIHPTPSFPQTVDIFVSPTSRKPMVCL